MEAEKKSDKHLFPSVAETRIEAVLEDTEDIPTGQVVTAEAHFTRQDSDESTHLEAIAHFGPHTTADKEMEDAEDKTRESRTRSKTKACQSMIYWGSIRVQWF